MLKNILIVSLIVTFVLCDDASKSAGSVPHLNSTQQQQQHQKSAEISKSNATISETKNINKNVNKEGKGSAELINKEKEQDEPVMSESTMDEVDDGVDFKYYWVLLVFSSLSIISIIVFKSFRMRKSRAENKYGKPKEADEIQPLGKSKWDDDSSENEDEIFDINFLKNTRLNPHREDV